MAKSYYSWRMSSHERETSSQAGQVCPACKHPVTAELKRHRTMGAYVPVWKPGPCHNPGCPKNVPGEKGPGNSPPEP